MHYGPHQTLDPGRNAWHKSLRKRRNTLKIAFLTQESKNFIIGHSITRGQDFDFFVSICSRAYFRYYQGDQNEIKNMLLAFMNNIQAIYHFKSLGRTIDFTIVHLEMMQRTPFKESRGYWNLC